MGGGIGEISACMEPYLGIDLSELGECLTVAGKGSCSGRSEANFGAEFCGFCCSVLFLTPPEP